jgi:phage gp29-like protein
MRWNPIRGLTPERLISYLDSWRIGFFRNAGMMWDAMERRDYQLQIVAPKRKKAVARRGYDVVSVDKLDDSQKDLAEQQVEFLKYFYDHISVTSAMEPDEQGGMSLLARQMMDAVGKRYAVHEIVWEPQADGNLSARFIFCPIWWFEGTRGKLRFLDSEFQVYGRDMEDGGWLVTVHDGVMESCSVVYLFKSLPIKSWLNYLDKFGMPGIHGKTDAQQGTKEWDDFVTAVSQFAEEFSAVTNRECELNLIEAKGQTNGDAFNTLVEKMDRALTQIWRGGDLGTTSSKDGTGASLQKNESDILEADDAIILEETLALKVSRNAIAWKFGPDAPVLAMLKFREAEDPTAESFQRDVFKGFLADGTVSDVLANQTDLKALVADVGLPVNEEYVDPYLPVRDGSGQLVSGDLLKDSTGQIIGAEPQAPEPDPNAAEEPGKPGLPGQPKTTKPAATASNERVGGPSAQLEANGVSALAKALALDLEPLMVRLAAIMKISDPELMEVKLRKFLADLDQVKTDLAQDPAVANELRKLLSSAMVTGLTSNKK